MRPRPRKRFRYRKRARRAERVAPAQRLRPRASPPRVLTRRLAGRVPRTARGIPRERFPPPAGLLGVGVAVVVAVGVVRVVPARPNVFLRRRRRRRRRRAVRRRRHRRHGRHGRHRRHGRHGRLDAAAVREASHRRRARTRPRARVKRRGGGRKGGRASTVPRGTGRRRRRRIREPLVPVRRRRLRGRGWRGIRRGRLHRRRRIARVSVRGGYAVRARDDDDAGRLVTSALALVRALSLSISRIASPVDLVVSRPPPVGDPVNLLELYRHRRLHAVIPAFDLHVAVVVHLEPLSQRLLARSPLAQVRNDGRAVSPNDIKRVVRHYPPSSYWRLTVASSDPVVGVPPVISLTRLPHGDPPRASARVRVELARSVGDGQDNS